MKRDCASWRSPRCIASTDASAANTSRVAEANVSCRFPVHSKPMGPAKSSRLFHPAPVRIKAV